MLSRIDVAPLHLFSSGNDLLYAFCVVFAPVHRHCILRECSVFRPLAVFSPIRRRLASVAKCAEWYFLCRQHQTFQDQW